MTNISVMHSFFCWRCGRINSENMLLIKIHIIKLFMYMYMYAQESLYNLIGQNIIMWGVLTDGKTWLIKIRAVHVPVVLFSRRAMCDTDLNQSDEDCFT